MKGDYVQVTVVTGDATATLKLEAGKAGRSVVVKYGTKWLEVSERTRPTTTNRTGRSTGNSLKLRLDSVVAVEERRQDPDEGAVRPRRSREATPEETLL